MMRTRAMRPDAAVLLLLLAELALSLAAGMAGGVASRLLHYASYLLPLALFLLFFAGQGCLAAQRPTVAGLRRVLPLLPIFLAAVMLVSTLTGSIMTALGLPTGGSAAEGGLGRQILQHALVPAVLEELLMRLCVLSLLADRSPARAVPQCALLFALLHASLYQLPYAFVGGLFLSLAALSGGSVLFAVLFHFTNNLLSLLLQRLPLWLGEQGGLAAQLAVTFMIFLLAGFSVLVLLRRKRKPLPSTRGWLRELICSPLVVYVLLMLLYACL